MNIYNYIDDYGIYSFKEKKFNEVDAVIFSFLSYANFENVLEKNQKCSIQEIGRRHLGIFPGEDRNVMAVRDGNKLLRYLKDTKRYKDCLISHYEYIGNEDIQFGAISIEYTRNHVFISFEGTDELFSGWKENFILSYKFPTMSHKKAIDYLNKYYTFSTKKIIVGGHSKGGNLALAAAMDANFFVRSRIEKIYSGDGPGLLDNEYKSKKYEKVKKKYIHIIPDYSFVGLLLNHVNDKVVKSSNKGILAHNIIYWEVEGSHFKRAPLSPLSKELDRELKKWFSRYGEEDKMRFVKNLDFIFKKANIHSITEIKEKNRLILNLIYESKEMDSNTKKILIDFFLILVKCFSSTKKEELKQFVSNLFKIKKREE